MLHKIKSQTFRNFSVTSVGVALSQLITILSMPFVARLCGVKEFGEFNFYVSLAAIFVVLSSFKVESIFFTVHHNLIDRLVLFFRSFFFSSVVVLSVLSMVVSLFFNESYTLNIIVVALVVYSIGIFEFYLQYNVRVGNFGLNSKLRVFRAISFPVLCYFSYLAFEINSITVLLALAISNAFPLLVLNKSNFNISDFIWSRDLYLVFREEIRKVALFQVPASFARTISASVVIIMAGYMSMPEVGFFSLALKMLIAPASVFILAVSEVFKRILVTEKTKALSVYHSIASMGLFVSLTLAFGMSLFGHWVLDLFMGGEWVGAIDYMNALAPYFVAVVVFSPITHVYLTENKQHYDLAWQFYNLTSLVIVTHIGLQHSTLQATYYFSWMATCNLAVSASYCYYVLRGRG